MMMNLYFFRPDFFPPLNSLKSFLSYVPDEDSISDWSSDSCGWSEDEMGADLEVIASPLSGNSVASTTGSQETVRCVCEVEEENDFMLQVIINLACTIPFKS